jgi:hypothetical protein
MSGGFFVGQALGLRRPLRPPLALWGRLLIRRAKGVPLV